MSLRHQIVVEAKTCEQIIEAGQQAGVVDAHTGVALRRALQDAIAPSLAWISDDPSELAAPHGATVYHDVAAGLGVDCQQARQRLGAATPGTEEADALEDFIWQSGRGLDSRRAQALTKIVCATASAPE